MVIFETESTQPNRHREVDAFDELLRGRHVQMEVLCNLLLELRRSQSRKGEVENALTPRWTHGAEVHNPFGYRPRVLHDLLPKCRVFSPGRSGKLNEPQVRASHEIFIYATKLSAHRFTNNSVLSV